MKSNIDFVPEDEDELVFLEQVAQARIDALEHGVDPDVVDRVLLLFVLEGGGIDHIMNEPSQKSVCPVCGSVVESVESEGIGEDPVVRPCGCVVSYDDLPDGLLDMLME